MEYFWSCKLTTPIFREDEHQRRAPRITHGLGGLQGSVQNRNRRFAALKAPMSFGWSTATEQTLKNGTRQRHHRDTGRSRIVITYPFSPTRSWYCRISVCSSCSSSKLKPSKSWHKGSIDEYSNVKHATKQEKAESYRKHQVVRAYIHIFQLLSRRWGIPSLCRGEETSTVRCVHE